MKSPTILYAYPCRWEMQMMPGRQRCLVEALSHHARVVVLEEPVIRGRLHAPSPRAERVNDTITVIHDAMGWRLSRLGRRLGRMAAIDSLPLHALLRQIGVDDYVYWLSAASTQFLWGMKLDRLVYDCIDPCFDPAAQAMFDRVEFGIAQRAKVVFATAQSLLDRMKRVNADSYLLPNGCSESEFAPEELSKLARPPALAARNGKIVGYMGTFDSRVDTELLVAAARQLPNVTFALAGRINPDQEHRVAPLRSLPNIILTGPVSVEDGRAFVASFDVGLIPFIPGPVSDAINPVKMYMYLMAGKPVVSSWIQECRRCEPLVLPARNTDEFVSAIKTALASDATSAAARTEFARKNTWAVRASEAMRILDQRGLLASEPSTRVAS